LELGVPSSDGLPKNGNVAGRWLVVAGPWTAGLVLRPAGVGVTWGASGCSRGVHLLLEEQCPHILL